MARQGPVHLNNPPPESLKSQILQMVTRHPHAELASVASKVPTFDEQSGTDHDLSVDDITVFALSANHLLFARKKRVARTTAAMVDE